VRELALALLLTTSVFADELSCPAGFASSLAATDSVAWDNSAYDVWELAGTQDQSVTIGLSATSFDPFLILIDPIGVPLAANDDLATGTDDASLTYTLTSTGTWLVIVNSLDAGGVGDYYLSLTSPSCATPVGPKRRALRH